MAAATSSDLAALSSRLDALREDLDVLRDIVIAVAYPETRDTPPQGGQRERS